MQRNLSQIRSDCTELRNLICNRHEQFAFRDGLVDDPRKTNGFDVTLEMPFVAAPTSCSRRMLPKSCRHAASTVELPSESAQESEALTGIC